MFFVVEIISSGIEVKHCERKFNLVNFQWIETYVFHTVPMTDPSSPYNVLCHYKFKQIRQTKIMLGDILMIYPWK